MTSTDTDALYDLYLQGAGGQQVQLTSPTLEQRAAVALGFADAHRGQLRKREHVREAVEELLKPFEAPKYEAFRTPSGRSI